MSEMEWDWDQGVFQNMSTYLGVDLQYVLGIPKQPLEGDRMLYLLRGGRKTAEQIKQRIVSQWQVDGELLARPTHPHVSNLDSVALNSAPEDLKLRATDLLGELCFRRGQRDYLDNDFLAPNKNWRVRWLLGSVFLSGRRILVYSDFRYDRVGIIFTEPFFLEGADPRDQKKQASRLLERLQGVLTLKNRYRRNEGYRWIKIVNISGGPQYVSMMDRDGKISLEEIPYFEG